VAKSQDVVARAPYRYAVGVRTEPDVLSSFEREYMSDTRIEDGSEAEEPPTVFPPPGSTHVVLPLTAEDQQLAGRAKDILFNAELADLVLEHLPDALVIVDESGIIQRVNTQAEILSGYQRTQLIGQPVEILLPEAQRQAHEVARHIYMEAPHLRPIDLGLPLHIRRKTGGVVPIYIGLSPMVTSRGTWIIATLRPRH
jgi:PAS domain S-box-containing protein